MKGFMQKLLRFLAMKALIVKGHFDTRCMMRNARHGKKVNEKLLKRILRVNKDSEYGRKYGFGEIRSPEEYKKKVPVVRYEELWPYIERMYYKNEPGVLCSRRVVGYARSSGSVGKPKFIPKTDSDVKIYTKYTVTRFLSLADSFLREQGKRKMKPARGLNLVTRYDFENDFGLPATNVADIGARKYAAVYPYILNLPLGKQFSSQEIDMKYASARFGLEDRDTCYLFYVFSKAIAELLEYICENWRMLADDIEHGTVNADVFVRDDIREELRKVMRPDPERAAEIRRECEKGIDETIISRLWPNLSVISAIGTSSLFEGFTEIIRSYAADVPFDYSIYGASEGLFAAAYEINKPELLLLTDSCYYEFVDPDDETAEKTLGLHELEIGKEYEIIVTNQSGFYRYRFNDIIRVLGYYHDTPILSFVQRKGQLLNVTGEKTNMEQMTEAIKRLSERKNVKISEWTVFVDRGEEQYRYGILFECDADLTGCADEFEQILREVNPQYAYYEGNQLIDPPVILRQIPGTHEAWKQTRVAIGASVDQVKLVRILDTDEKRKFFLSRTLPSDAKVKA